MRIALVGNQAFTLVRFRVPLIRALVSEGHEVFAFMPDADEEDQQTVRKVGATPVDFYMDRTGTNPLNDGRSVLSLWRCFRELQVDLTLCYFLKPIVYGGMAAALAGVPNRYSLIEGAGTTFGASSNESFAKRALKSLIQSLYRFSLAKSKRVFFLNREDRAEFIEHNLVNGDQTETIPGIGIDLSEYSATPLPEGPLRFAMATRLLGEKGVREYAEAARRLKVEHPEVECVLLGGLESNPDGIALDEVEQWGNEGVLHWPGRVDNMQEWLRSAHVFVLPSYYREGLPRSIMEAMAIGRPVITTDWVGCRETVDHEVNGLLVPIQDSDALLMAMKRMIRSADDLQAMGQASRQLAEERFDVQRINRLFMEGMELQPGPNERPVIPA